MKKIIYLSLASALMLTTLNACKKEGCTDSYATNYDEKADTDNGTCKYTGSVSFWYNQATSLYLESTGVVALSYYVDNQLIGSSAASVYYPSDPGCGAPNVVKKTMELGVVKTKTVTYKVLSQDGTEIWSGNVTFDGSKTCTSYQLTN